MNNTIMEHCQKCESSAFLLHYFCYNNLYDCGYKLNPIDQILLIYIKDNKQHE
jgi:hypothetical protein